MKMISNHQDVHIATPSVQDINNNNKSSARARGSANGHGHCGLSHDEEFDEVRDRGVEVARKDYLHLFLLSRTEIWNVYSLFHLKGLIYVSFDMTSETIVIRY